MEWTMVTIRFRDGLLRSLILPIHDNRRELKETAHFENQTASRVNDEFTTDKDSKDNSCEFFFSRKGKRSKIK